jgi:hypothetical protein
VVAYPRSRPRFLAPATVVPVPPLLLLLLVVMGAAAGSRLMGACLRLVRLL